MQRRTLVLIGVLFLSIIAITSVVHAQASMRTLSVEQAPNEYCVWNVGLQGNGFKPNAKVYLAVSGFAFNCANEAITFGYENWEIGTTDHTGSFSFTIRHGDWGVYNFVMRDDYGNSASHRVEYTNPYKNPVDTPRPPQLTPTNTPVPQQVQPQPQSSNTPTPVRSGGGGSTGHPAACYAPEPVGVGYRARVTPGGVANRLRSGPGLNYQQIGSIKPEEQFDVIGEPECVDGYRWWLVNFNGVVGWTADGDNKEYWIQVVKLSQDQVNQVLDAIDLSTACEAVSSATLSVGNRRQAALCVQSVLGDVSEEEALNFIGAVADCGVSQAANIVLAVQMMKLTANPILSVQAIFSPDDVANCVGSVFEVLGF